jgi:hypothetical protein
LSLCLASQARRRLSTHALDIEHAAKRFVPNRVGEYDFLLLGPSCT